MTPSPGAVTGGAHDSSHGAGLQLQRFQAQKVAWASSSSLSSLLQSLCVLSACRSLMRRCPQVPPCGSLAGGSLSRMVSLLPRAHALPHLREEEEQGEAPSSSLRKWVGGTGVGLRPLDD